eukprot:9160575-Heterocapsa_arctica.AAC.1
MVEEKTVTENIKNQNTPEEVQEEESAIETQEYLHVAGYNQGDAGKQQEELETLDYKDFQILADEKEVIKSKKTTKRGSSDNEDEEYPGVSSQKRVNIRAEQLF